MRTIVRKFCTDEEWKDWKPLEDRKGSHDRGSQNNRPPKAVVKAFNKIADHCKQQSNCNKITNPMKQFYHYSGGRWRLK